MSWEKKILIIENDTSTAMKTAFMIAQAGDEVLVHIQVERGWIWLRKLDLT